MEEIESFFRDIINNSDIATIQDEDTLNVNFDRRDIVADIDLPLPIVHRTSRRSRILRFKYTREFLRFNNPVNALRNEILSIINSFSFDDTAHTRNEPQPITEFIIAINGRNIIVRPQ